MATQATFSLPSDRFPLGSIFEEHPDVTIELERIIPSRDVIIPYFWVRGTEVDDIEAAFSDHPGLERIHLVDSIDDEYLLRAKWPLGFDGVLPLMSRRGVVLIRAVGTEQQWTFEIRGDTRTDISEFEERCREAEIPITIQKPHDLTPVETNVEAALTDKQQEALVLAYERGYFETPREVTMADIGTELDISEQAVASRLRRGIKYVLGNALTDVPDP
jgi:predicted DNA binding protein